jgi:hypothetical protein
MPSTWAKGTANTAAAAAVAAVTAAVTTAVTAAIATLVVNITHTNMLYTGCTQWHKCI